MYQKYFKRLLDIVLSLFLIILLSPVFLVLSICVYFGMGSPVMFSQERIGKDEKIFKLYKFRTMTDARDENGELLPDEVRLTKFGKLLRTGLVLGQGMQPCDFRIMRHPLEECSWSLCMLVCLWHLTGCSYIYMLNNWRDSRGARIEHRWATILRKKIIYQP